MGSIPLWGPESGFQHQWPDLKALLIPLLQVFGGKVLYESSVEVEKLRKVIFLSALFPACIARGGNEKQCIIQTKFY